MEEDFHTRAKEKCIVLASEQKVKGLKGWKMMKII
jgi:hypothetical protein